MSYMTQNGQKMYKCLQGKWEYRGGESEILDARTLATVGAYREIIDPVKKTISGWWELVNDSGDKAESGHQYSTVTGKIKMRNKLMMFCGIAKKKKKKKDALL
jgi:hypothetical protein